jgi:molecular chaperone GrpE
MGDGQGNGRPKREAEGIKVVDRRWWAREGGESAGAAEPQSKPSYVEELERRLAEKDREIQQAVAEHRAAARDLEEARVRIRREISRDVERARRAVLAELLDVLDNLDRSIEAARGAANAEAVLEGVSMVRDQFLAKLQGFGVRRLDPIGQPFDPTSHEAISTVPASDLTHDGVVSAVVTPGYSIGDDVLRPARVVVAKATISPETGSA